MEKFVRYIVFYGLIASMMSLLLLTFNRNEVIADIPSDVEPEQPVSDTLEGWQHKYTIVPQGQGIYWVTRDYQLSSLEVEVAAKAMNQATGKLAKSGTTFEVTLVFAKPMAIEDFEKFVKDTGIKSSLSFVQATDPNNNLVEASIPPSKAIGNVESEGIDSKIVNTIQTRQRNPLKVLGVISTDVVLNLETYNKVNSDGRVYAFDVTPYLITERVKREHSDAKSEKIQVSRSLLYNAMQKVGAAPNGG